MKITYLEGLSRNVTFITALFADDDASIAVKYAVKSMLNVSESEIQILLTPVKLPVSAAGESKYINPPVAGDGSANSCDTLY